MSILGIAITYKLLVALCTKIDLPNPVTFLIRTPIFDWLCGPCASKNGWQKDVFQGD